MADRIIEETLVSGTIAQLQGLLLRRRLSVHEVVQWTLSRIALVSQGPQGLNAVGDLCEQALADARQTDARIAADEPLGPLFGVPVLLKDNILTRDGMRASAGVLALAAFMPRQEATLVARLRKAGAIIVGKTRMTELADYVSDVMPSGFSGAAGMVLDPLSGAPYGRGLGSSVGSAAAVAAGLVPVAIGTETQNSIQTPAHHSSVVGLKPSTGRVSRSGVVPLVPSQDSPGPLARNVVDAALVLDCIAGPDCQDTATLQLTHALEPLRSAADLRGVRVGVPRRAVADRPEFEPCMPAFEAFLSRLSAHGAIVVDPCDIPSAPAVLGLRSSVFRTEFKAAFDSFLHANESPCGIGSLDHLIAWNRNHPDAIPYGQPLLIAAAASADLDDPAYRADRLLDVSLCRIEGIDRARSDGAVDVLVAPMGAVAKITGKAGAPAVAVPAGTDAAGRPFGVTVFSSHGLDSDLVRIAGAIEHAAGQRVIPSLGE